MKIANYKGKLYRYSSNKRTCSIITTQNEKTIDGFVFENGMYFKNIQEADVSEIFEVRYRIKYDTGISRVPDMWEVGTTSQDITREKILIRYSDGVLPGWKTEEKNVCVKYIDKNKAEFGEVVKIYYKKDHVILDSPEKTVQKVDLDTLIRTHFEYLESEL